MFDQPALQSFGQEIKETEEQEARRLRDSIYGHGSDHNWNQCKDEWLEPANLAWLRRHARKTCNLQPSTCNPA